jgi:hypothetical protein
MVGFVLQQAAIYCHILPATEDISAVLQHVNGEKY